MSSGQTFLLLGGLESKLASEGSSNGTDYPMYLNTHAWACAWHFHFSIGALKSAVMVLGCGRTTSSQLRMGECNFASRAPHHACTSWTNEVHLPDGSPERILQAYVRPSACFGLEFISAGPQNRRFQTRFLRWCRRLFTWPHGSPGAVVQGQLGWPDVNTMRFSHAIDLCSLLLRLPAHCCAGHIARYACYQSFSWIQSVISELQNDGVPHPQDSGIHVACSASLSQRWFDDFKFVLSNRAGVRYATVVQEASLLQSYALWQPCPHMQHVVYGPQVAARNARYRGFARCGHHCFHDGRAARQRDSNTALARCRFGATGVNSLKHTLLHCRAHLIPRQMGAFTSRGRTHVNVTVVRNLSVAVVFLVACCFVL